jgi:hypothetical protein
MTEARRFRTRYPAHAVALVVGAVLLAVAEVIMMGLLLMPLIPLIPLFFAAVVGHGCLLAAALDYARSHAHIEPIGSPHSERPKGAREAPHRGTPQPAWR